MGILSIFSELAFQNTPTHERNKRAIVCMSQPKNFQEAQGILKLFAVKKSKKMIFPITNISLLKKMIIGFFKRFRS